jgi:hypothetical protein
VRCRVWQQGHKPRVLQGDAQLALVLGAGACLAARLDLAAIRQIPAQARTVLIVYLAYVINAKRTDLAA